MLFTGGILLYWYANDRYFKYHISLIDSRHLTMRQKANVMERKIRLKSVNPHITCFLCRGYLIEATTITECLHTFCKSCLVKYLEENVACPKCEIVIHQSHPLSFISHDRTMQDIVYKLVPNIQGNERKKIQEFYRRRGLPIPESEEKCVSGSEVSEPQDEDTSGDAHRSDEQLNLELECSGGPMKLLRRNFIRGSSLATISHLKKFLALKLYNNVSKYEEVDVLCNEEILGKDHTLKFINVTRWHIKDAPMKLQYRKCIMLTL